MTSFGTYLKKERERRAVRLDEIASATRISPQLLHALESDAVEIMPPLPITKGFLRAYALCLGLPAEETVLRYVVFREAASRPRTEPPGPPRLGDRIGRAALRVRAYLTGNDGQQVF
jgi:cytoskeletal protein RodZ